MQLEDDRHYIPPYEGVYLVRQDSLDRAPALREVLAKLAHSISTDEMRQLNYEVDGKKRGQAEVVREWLKRKGLQVEVQRAGQGGVPGGAAALGC